MWNMHNSTPMKKPNSTPKEMLKKRLAKMIKVPLNICNRRDDKKEYVKPELRSKKNNIVYRDVESKIQDERSYIPYNLPKHMRLFFTQQIKRKVGPEPFIMTEPRGIRDIDDSFFSIIEGRPLRQFCDTKVYMTNLRDITLFRANAAYLRDQILQINVSLQFEMKEYNEIHDQYIKTQGAFVRFAKDSYSKAKQAQYRAEEKALELEKMMDTLDSFSFEYVKRRNEVSSLIATYEILSRYKKFFNTLSPDWWKARYDNSYNLGSKLCMQFAEDVTSPSATHHYRESAMQLQELQPTLYFKEPTELIRVFEHFSIICINQLQRETVSKKVLRKVLSQRDALKQSMREDYEAIQASVQRCTDIVAFQEQYAAGLQTAYDKVLQNEFHKLYASYDANKLFTCVQYVHTQIYETPEDPRDDLCTLMRDIEKTYIEVMFGLDNLDQGIVKKATDTLFSEDINKMNRAQKAQRILRECRILRDGLFSSFEPPRTRRYNK